jgi:hypothetical protein
LIARECYTNVCRAELAQYRYRPINPVSKRDFSFVESKKETFKCGSCHKETRRHLSSGKQEKELSAKLKEPQEVFTCRYFI